MSAYFEPYLYMLIVHCLITAIFHVGELQTLDHNYGHGFDSHLGRDVVSLSKALIPVA